MDAHEDWLLNFLSDFASMTEPQRDAAIDALPPERRAALVALADVRAATGSADLIAALDSGHAGLERLYEVSDPGDLFAVINLALRDRPNLLVEALFAAVVVHRGWAKKEPAAVVALREAWIWHVYDQVSQAAGEELTP
ncbi:MAG TPA: hypothetical protein VKG82_06560 [Solirubrobacteraceae bacterium]|nr:hypothetical protein [Solirubrobacteraceae bacterium]